MLNLFFGVASFAFSRPFGRQARNHTKHPIESNMHKDGADNTASPYFRRGCGVKRYVSSAKQDAQNCADVNSADIGTEYQQPSDNLNNPVRASSLPPRPKARQRSRQENDLRADRRGSGTCQGTAQADRGEQEGVAPQFRINRSRRLASALPVAPAAGAMNLFP